MGENDLSNLIIGNTYSCVSTLVNEYGKQITVSFTQIFTGVSEKGELLFTSDKDKFQSNLRGIENVTSTIEICNVE